MSRLDRRPKHGAIPIPYTTPMVNGRPDFKATDPKAHNLSIEFKLCGVCGEWIAKPPYVFGMGPMCVAERFVFGTPMHPDECATAAFRLCPFISREHWERTPDSELGDRVKATNDGPLPPKPARTALVSLKRYRTFRNPDSGLLYTEWYAKDVERVEWWSYLDGKLQPEARS